MRKLAFQFLKRDNIVSDYVKRMKRNG